MIADQFITAYSRRRTSRLMHLDAISETDVRPRPDESTNYLLYAHVPFCPSLCPFCSFHRVKFQSDLARPYFAALQQEMRLYRDLGFNFSSLYVGGGTPTVIPELLCETIALARELFAVSEVSIETNPNHLTDRTLSQLKSVGLNRLSVGVQSFDNELLRAMGRSVPYGDCESIIDHLLRTQGLFDTLNADLIFNLPGQSQASLERDIDILKNRIGIDQVSFYPLMVSESAHQRIERTMGEVSHSHEKRLYRIISTGMAPQYHPSTAWCFSKSDAMVDEYIVDFDQYVGVGSGAFGYLDGTLYACTFSIGEYVNRVRQGRTGITMQRSFGLREQLLYDFLMCMFGGVIDDKKLRTKFGSAYPKYLWKELVFFRSLGAIRRRGHSWYVTESGRYRCVAMMREFLNGANQFRDVMRQDLAHLQ